MHWYLMRLSTFLKKKYGVPYETSVEFLESIVLPYVTVIGLGEDEYKLVTESLIKYKLKPSDSLHLGAMFNNNINLIITEDREFDKADKIKRLWIET